MEAQFVHICIVRIWYCKWIVDENRWLEAEISDPQDLFEMSALDIWFPAGDDDGNDAGDGDGGAGGGDAPPKKKSKYCKDSKTHKKKTVASVKPEAKKAAAPSATLLDEAAQLDADMSELHAEENDTIRLADAQFLADEASVDKTMDKKIRHLQERATKSTPFPPQ